LRQTRRLQAAPPGKVAIAAMQEQLSHAGVSANGKNAPVAPASVRPAPQAARPKKGGNYHEKHGENGHGGHLHH